MPAQAARVLCKNSIPSGTGTEYRKYVRSVLRTGTVHVRSPNTPTRAASGALNSGFSLVRHYGAEFHMYGVPVMRNAKI